MRNPSGYGGVKKLAGNRRRPYGVYVTTGYTIEKKIPKIDFLEGILTAELFKEVKEEYDAYASKVVAKAKQEQKCIGYYATRSEAMIALASYNKKPFNLDLRNMTFGEIYDQLYAEKFSKMKKSAKNSYKSGYARCQSLAKMKIVDIRKGDMQKILDENSCMSRSLLTNITKVFHAVYGFALENDICDKDYSKFLEVNSAAKKKEKIPFTKEEIKEIWRLYEANAFEGVDLILIQIYTGMRPGELFLLEKEDIHLEERWLYLKGTKTKAAKRIIPLHTKIIPLLEARMQAESEHLFTFKNGRKIIKGSYANEVFNNLENFLEVRHTPHECRHTFASLAADARLNQVLLKKIIGHAASDLTQDTYTHAYLESLVAEIDKIKV